MKRPKLESSPVPDQVLDILKNIKIGYLSVLSKSEELYSYPVAFHFSDLRLYFMTPVSAAKFKILRSNPTVSFIVDNGKVTTEACGAMIQGRAKIFTIGRTLVSILSVGPKIIGFTKKYPGMLSFYARGKELPDERKLYKYRLIRIDPSKIIYWLGYKFGRFIPKIEARGAELSLKLSRNESGLEISAKLLESADDNVPAEPVQKDHDWMARLDTVVSEGILSEKERKMLGSYKHEPASSLHADVAGRVTDEEKRLIKKSKC
jgi:Pyridoxamine 5'-phosphate oxidase